MVEFKENTCNAFIVFPCEFESQLYSENRSNFLMKIKTLQYGIAQTFCLRTVNLYLDILTHKYNSSYLVESRISCIYAA